MIRSLLLLSLVGCTNLEPVESTAPCTEAGYALARRIFECTDDGDLANARYLAFTDAYTCTELEWVITPDTGIIYTNAPADEVDYFHCAFAMGELPCELVESYGDDFAQWLTASTACPLILEAAQ